MRRGFLVPSKWRLPECQRMILPVDVILKRLAAPRCVFSFIFLFFFTISSSSSSFSLARFQRRIHFVLCRALRAFLRSRSRTGALLRRQQREQDVRFHPRPEFHLRVIDDVLQQTIHLRAAHILVRHFAAAMENHGLHLVSLAKEPDDLVLTHLIIVLGSRRPELHFLDVRALLMFSLLRGLSCSARREIFRSPRACRPAARRSAKFPPRPNPNPAPAFIASNSVITPS